MKENKETVKKLLENGIFQRWLDGEQLQVNISNQEWVDIDDPKFDRYFNCYRIKPTSKYREFKPEEFKLIIDRIVVSKSTNSKYKISEVSIKNNTLMIRVGYAQYCSDIILKEFEFEDGSPCGVLIE